MRKTMLRISKIVSVAFLFVLSALPAFAQNVITGTVTDSRTGSGVSNVTVTVKGTTTSAQTGADGTFRISAPSGTSTLVFTSVGFAPQEAVARGNTANISLVQTDQRLDEVVVVAYGTRRKGDLTGSVTQVTAKEFQKGNIGSSEQLLQGKVAGLEITTGGGSAGGGSKIRIRGTASLTASNDPLIVVDGVPVESNGIAGSANYLNTINPDDIESISVLKDASATALYGSRASNGVLIVTTKKGTRGRTRYNFNTQVSLSRVAENSYVDVFTGDEIRSIVIAEAAATGNNTYKDLLGKANTNWQNQIYQNAYSSNNNFSATGAMKAGSVSLPYRLSLGYYYQEGTIRTNKFDRFTTALNLSPKFLNDNLSVNLNFKYTHTQNQFANEGAVGAAVAMDPTQFVYNNNPKTGGFFEWNSPGSVLPATLATRNPVALLMLRDNTSRVNRIIGNVQLDYKLPFLPSLHLQANLGLDNASGRGNDNIDSTLATDYLTKGKRTHYEQKKRNYLADVSLFYEKDFGKGNKIDILAGHGYQDFYTDVFNFASYGQDGKVIESTLPTFATDKPQYRLESYIGRMNITLFDKYLLTGSIRRDASSKFSEDNRVGYFPAAAIAWKLKEEIFKNSNVVSDLKLRFGWGITGQQDGIALYSFQPIYYLGNVGAQYQLGNVFYPTRRPTSFNADLKWEQTTTMNLGLDFGFAKNRITGSIEVFKKETEDLLYTIPIAPGANFGVDLIKNVGSLENKGVEITVNTTPVRKRNFSWEFGFNVTYNETRITDLFGAQNPNFKGDDVSGIGGGTGNFIGKFAVGYAPYAYYVYKQVYDKATGKPIEGLYEDINRDGNVDGNDRYLYKKPSADFMFGLNTTLTYKKFSLGLTGHGMIGNYLYNNYNSGNGVLRTIQNPLLFTNNGSKDYRNTGFVNNQYFSDYYIENASFFRMDNINLGYNFGNVVRSGTSLRVSANIQNVFVLTKYSGTDPESASVTGVDNNIYPRPRIYAIGASLDF